MEGGGQIFYEWGSASHRKLFMRWWDGGWWGGVLEWKGGKGAKVSFDAGGERKREEHIRREGWGESSVNERVMERTVRERERRPSTQNEWERHTQLHGLIAGWAPAQRSLCQLSCTSARDQPKAWPLAQRERVIQPNKHWIDWKLYMDVLHPGWLTVAVQILLLTPVFI